MIFLRNKWGKERLVLYMCVSSCNIRGEDHFPLPTTKFPMAKSGLD